ncbi:Transglutaminase family protein [Rhodovastum atsumiense]|uniref:Transglutaminase family protein n=1 Tax=Rhodovastum atsumiense TaxID=504468 RepID=A0A5M6J4U3_9PROT|nr:transglutaminase family protein [Rhodovastum atsumiense]KAA5614598.1 transglutaminase family protein [Rhodovastum atsumiense]CAH2599905.1 Transglutaminase family protein [Rhodovastum atsumiense]
MRFSVRHETLYQYSAPVRFTPHLLRLTPRVDPTCILARSIVVTPEPVMRHEATDRFGNPITHVHFEGVSDILRVESSFAVDTFAAPALRDPGLPLLPWPTTLDDPLAGYRLQGAQDDAVSAFATALAAESGWAVLPFLDHLTRWLFTHLERRIRAGGAAQAPARTLALGSGACRDLAVLFMAACRSLGLAARFVSGYQARADTRDGRRHLHAWPEVFLPGLGWRGFDPTHGVAVDDGHVALCAAPDQAATMPVEGAFYGSDVTSTIAYHVEIVVG